MSSPKSGETNSGFKTAAFGFDKNDVNLYIAGLRKKMKTMEEEFQQKLEEAMENPAVSEETLNREREIIRTETAKKWSEKLEERNVVLKQQQVRIDELEDELNKSKEIIASLRTRISAVSADNSETDMNARAADAYSQFTRGLRMISGTIEKTLSDMDKRWNGVFGESVTTNENFENNQTNVSPRNDSAPFSAFDNTSINVLEVQNVDEKNNNFNVNFVPTDQKPEQTAIDSENTVPYYFDETSDSLDSMLVNDFESSDNISNKNNFPTDDSSGLLSDNNGNDDPQQFDDFDLIAENSDLLADNSAVSKDNVSASYAAADFGSDFSDLLSEDSPNGFELSSEPESKPENANIKPAEKDDDLGLLLSSEEDDEISDFLVTPTDENVVVSDDDFEKLLITSSDENIQIPNNSVEQTVKTEEPLIEEKFQVTDDLAEEKEENNPPAEIKNEEKQDTDEQVIENDIRTAAPFAEENLPAAQPSDEQTGESAQTTEIFDNENIRGSEPVSNVNEAEKEKSSPALNSDLLSDILSSSIDDNESLEDMFKENEDEDELFADLFVSDDDEDDLFGDSNDSFNDSNRNFKITTPSNNFEKALLTASAFIADINSDTDEVVYEEDDTNELTKKNQTNNNEDEPFDFSMFAYTENESEDDMSINAPLSEIIRNK